MKRLIKIHPTDNVAVAVSPLDKGEKIDVDGTLITLVDDIPVGHKVALGDLSTGDNIIKYGYPIGHAAKPISVGSWVNEHVVKTNLGGKLAYSYDGCKVNQDHLSQTDCLASTTFLGYQRTNGSVGIRNDVWIVPTVGCVNDVARRLADAMRSETQSDHFVCLTHEFGCSQLGDDHENTRKVLRNLVLHPNAGAVMVLGLGCENNQPDQFKAFCNDYDPERVRFVTLQQIEGDEDEYCLEVLRQLYAITRNDKRTPCPISALRIGLKCGGSDAFSGITANPLLGRVTDLTVGCGGTALLTEVPEMFGAEHLLMERCTDRDTFQKTVALINHFKDYFTSYGQPTHENPSPGNKAGGISTLEEKSLGCTQKSGSVAVSEVLAYGERVTTQHDNGHSSTRQGRLILLEAPGNDIVSTTALAAAGCQIILFTTGRGTPLCSCVPTLKVSSNTAIAERKPNWIDFNAGTLLTGSSIDTLTSQLFDLIIATANGLPTKGERNRCCQIAIFKNGVTL